MAYNPFECIHTNVMGAENGAGHLTPAGQRAKSAKKRAWTQHERAGRAVLGETDATGSTRRRNAESPN